ncbi:MAG: hypothetical protein AVDCRST_MAG93-26, partial [uncultured Chloroflexia bacterium]
AIHRATGPWTVAGEAVPHWPRHWPPEWPRQRLRSEAPGV